MKTTNLNRTEEAGKIYARRFHKCLNLISSTCAALLILALLSGITTGEEKAGDEQQYDVNVSTDNGMGRYQANNPAHNFSVDFSDQGVAVSSLSEKERWNMELLYTGYGRETEIERAPNPAISASSNRAQLHRGPVVEWYINDAEGLEQGLTISRPPKIKKQQGGGLLYLEFLYSGELEASLTKDGGSILFSKGSGPAPLVLSKLKVIDANQNILPSWLDVQKDSIRILIDDSKAVYPILVDPILQSTTFTKTGGEDFYGRSLAMADVNCDGFKDIIVGSDRHTHTVSAQGLIEVYNGTLNGPSTTVTTHLHGPGTAVANDGFGNSVAAAGNVDGDFFNGNACEDLLVTKVGSTGVGHAYILTGSSTGLSASRAFLQRSNIYSGHAAIGDANGDSYSDFAIVSGGFGSPVVNVYYGNPFSSTKSSVGPSIGPFPERFPSITGADLNSDGFSDLIIGLGSLTDGSNERVVVFFGSGSGISSSVGFQISTPQQGSSFGRAVKAGDVNGDGRPDLIVGAPTFKNALGIQSGAVYVYLNQNGSIASSPSQMIENPMLIGASTFNFGLKIDVADMDNDFLADLAASDFVNDAIYTFTGTRTSGFTTSKIITKSVTTNYGETIALGDVHKDGPKDMVVWNGGRIIDLYRTVSAVPIVRITSPTTGSILSNTVNISITATDDEQVTLIETYLFNNTTGVFTFLGNGTLVPLDTKLAGPNGGYTLYSAAYDARGNIGYSDQVFVTINNSFFLNTSLTSPLNGATLANTQTVSATANGSSPITRVEFYADGITLIGTATASPYSIQWDTKTIANGTHTLMSRAFDSLGNSASSLLITVTVSNATCTKSTQLLKNQGFESGNVNWSATSGVIGTKTTADPARSGSFRARLAANNSSISQQVSIPANACSAKLVFFVRIITAETTTINRPDKLFIQVIDSAGVVKNPLVLSNLDKNSGYVSKTVDLSAFKGKTVTIKFLATENTTNVTRFLIDDTAVNIVQ